MVILSFIFGVVITFFALGLVVHCKDNEPKNNVRFFVKRISHDYYSLCINSDAPARLKTSRLHTAGFRIHLNPVL